MGADYVVSRGCRLQKSLGEDFFPLVKRRAQLEDLESRREEIERVSGQRFEDLALAVNVSGRPERQTTIRELRESVAVLADTSECAGCPLAGGRPLGCYRYVPYPVDASFEEAFFAWFCESLVSDDPQFAIANLPDGTPLTAAQLVIEHVLPTLHPNTLSAWRSMRGPAEQGGLAARPAPIEVADFFEDGEALTSGDALAMAFAPAIDGREALQLYAHLFQGFILALRDDGVDVNGANTFAHARELSELLTAALELPEVTVFVDS